MHSAQSGKNCYLYLIYTEGYLYFVVVIYYKIHIKQNNFFLLGD